MVTDTKTRAKFARNYFWWSEKGDPSNVQYMYINRSRRHPSPSQARLVRRAGVHIIKSNRLKKC